MERDEKECEERKALRLQREPDGSTPRQVAPKLVESVLSSPGERLAGPVRAEMEAGFGCDLSRVRIHTDGRSAESARAINATAYTVGDHVVFGAGRDRPGTPEGRRLLAHELAHVLQQPTTGASPARNQLSAGNSAAAALWSVQRGAAQESGRGWHIREGAPDPNSVVHRQTDDFVAVGSEPGVEFVGNGRLRPDERGLVDEFETAQPGVVFIGDQQQAPEETGGPPAAGFEEGPSCPTGLLKLKSRGRGVADVQQRLNIAGADPPLEVDGVFGEKTRRAVVEFQASHDLDPDGVVGPLTCAKLEEITRPAALPEVPPSEPPTSPEPLPREEAPQPPAETPEQPEEGPGAEGETAEACPTDDEIESAIVDVQSARTQTSQAFAFGATEQQDRHLGIKEAVAAFHERVDVRDRPPSTNLSQTGQFFFRDNLRPLVADELSRVERAGAGDFDVNAFVADGRAVLADIRDDVGFKERIKRMEAAAKKTFRDDLKPSLRALLAQHESAGRLHLKWWREINKTDQAPDFAPFRSVRTVKALDDLEKHACGDYVVQVALRIEAKQGIAGKGEAGPVFRGRPIATGRGKQDRRPITSKGSEPRMLGDVVEQAGVGAAVEEVKRALRAGQIVQARVISGVGVGIAKEAQEFDPPDSKPRPIRVPVAGEHSLLIIGFEGDTFVFHDPDATTSSTPEPGFGFLVHDENEGRLSTAFINNDFPVNQDGDHPRGDHRYQVTTLSAA
jgi:hypothetical protein